MKCWWLDMDSVRLAWSFYSWQGLKYFSSATGPKTALGTATTINGHRLFPLDKAPEALSWTFTSI
jgi:hypothetical protein